MKKDFRELLETSILGLIVTVMVLSMHGKFDNDKKNADVSQKRTTDVRDVPAAAVRDTVATPQLDTLYNNFVQRVR